MQCVQASARCLCACVSVSGTHTAHHPLWRAAIGWENELFVFLFKTSSRDTTSEAAASEWFGALWQALSSRIAASHLPKAHYRDRYLLWSGSH
uniref:Putative secreted protein n=1 Tax=Anopheles darlingi TaxID=43151 RepID=A0A2M4D035_ANODA